MPVTSEAQRRLMEAVCYGDLRGPDLPSKAEACEYLEKTPSGADLPERAGGSARARETRRG